VSINNFIPTVWSARLQAQFDKAFIFRNLVNGNWEGEIRNAGDSVKITTPGNITVNDYSGTVTYETPQSTQQTLLIDQDKYWAFGVDDADRIQANVNLVDVYTRRAAVALADKVDQNIASLYTDTGATTVALDISANSTAVRGALVDANKELDNNSVPRSGRWLVVSPTVLAGIMKSTDYTAASELGDELKVRGTVGMLEGFSIFVSRNVQISTQHKCLFGTTDAITFAEQLINTEAVRRDAAFEDGIRGRMVFGRKVVQPEALGLLNVTV
jgi:hypothetical protein